jgi:hypothetical protein
MGKDLLIPGLLSVLATAAIAVRIGDTILFDHTHRFLQITTTVAAIALTPFAVVAWREHFRKP